MKLRQTVAALACALPILALAQSSTTATTTTPATSITGSTVAIPPSATTAITGDAASDQVLLNQIKAELVTDPAVAGAQIDVQVSGGRVTLTGMTRDTNQLEAAKSIAQGVAGAANVTSNLVTGRQ